MWLAQPDRDHLIQLLLSSWSTAQDAVFQHHYMHCMQFISLRKPFHLLHMPSGTQNYHFGAPFLYSTCLSISARPSVDLFLLTALCQRKINYKKKKKTTTPTLVLPECWVGEFKRTLSSLSQFLLKPLPFTYKHPSSTLDIRVPAKRLWWNNKLRV